MRRLYHPKPKKSTVFKRFARWRADRLVRKTWTVERSLDVDRLLARLDAAGVFDHREEGAFHG